MSEEFLPLVSRMVNRWLSERKRFEALRDEWGASMAPYPLTGRPVVALSRQRGTRGIEIARILATEMRYGWFEPDVLDFMTRHVAVRCDLVESLEEAEQVELKQWLATRPSSDGLAEVVRIFGLQGLAVLVGDGMSTWLDDVPAMHVRLVAPVEFRVRTLMETEGMSEPDAHQEIAGHDEQQARWVRERFYVGIDDPHRVHLTINRAWVDMDPAVQMIRQAMRLRFGKHMRMSASSEG